MMMVPPIGPRIAMIQPKNCKTCAAPNTPDGRSISFVTPASALLKSALLIKTVYCCSTRTRCLTLLIIPRTDAVSSSSRVRPILFSPSPIRVKRWSAFRPIALLVWVTITVALAAILLSPVRMQRRRRRSQPYLHVLQECRRRACRAFEPQPVAPGYGSMLKKWL